MHPSLLHRQGASLRCALSSCGSPILRFGPLLQRRQLQSRAGSGASAKGGSGGATGSDHGSGGWMSDNNSLAAGMLAVALGTIGLSYASVPLYRMFCQATGFGGTVKTHNTTTQGGEDEGYNLPSDPASLPNNRMLKITFNTDVDASLPWSFTPVQRSVRTPTPGL